MLNPELKSIIVCLIMLGGFLCGILFLFWLNYKAKKIRGELDPSRSFLQNFFYIDPI
jgi:hypothetical protein